MSIHGGADTSRALARVPLGVPAGIADEGIRFESRGAVLVIGPAAYVTHSAERLAVSLRVLGCATGEIPQTPLHANPALMSGRIAAVTGYLGRFTATAHGKDGQLVDMGGFSPNGNGFFDLVLDLNTPPLLAMEVKPLGYYAPPIGQSGIDDAIAQLATLTGSFRKPRFFHYDKELCAHGMQGVAGCTRCLNACPAGAIGSSGDAIAIDDYLCQGCATCMLACPSGALGYASPAPAETLRRLTRSLAAGSAHDRELPLLLLHEETDRSVGAEVDDSAAATDKPLLRFALPAIASVGLDLWLAALAQGVAQVIVKLPADLPASTRGELNAQAGVAQVLLHAIGANPHRIVVWDSSPPSAPVAMRESAITQPLPPLSTGTTKRNVLIAALERLQALCGAAGAALPASIDLPEDAPFGAVEVNRASCTLCKACVHLCPTGALLAEATSSQLMKLIFVESHCVQCRLCERACPEHSIVLKQRLLLDPDARRTARILHEDARHRCPACDTPFIGRTLLNKSLQIMRDQALLDDAGLSRLRLCPACRAQNYLTL